MTVSAGRSSNNILASSLGMLLSSQLTVCHSIRENIPVVGGSVTKLKKQATSIAYCRRMRFGIEAITEFNHYPVGLETQSRRTPLWGL